MFNLEQSIADWRRQMADSGIRTPDLLDELEGHLHDDVAQQVRSGLNAEQAFRTAIQRMGHADVLKSEFAKIGRANAFQERLKHFVLTLAGIPNPILATNMNTSNSNIEPGWATYLKAATFLLPAVSLWALNMVFVFPKFQQICLEAGVAVPSVYQVTIFLKDYNVLICGGLILALVLLEWRSGKWPRYRRATLGVAVFFLNSAVLILIGLMVVLALLAVPALHHAK